MGARQFRMPDSDLRRLKIRDDGRMTDPHGHRATRQLSSACGVWRAG
jgi:hypothetical protein